MTIFRFLKYCYLSHVGFTYTVCEARFNHLLQPKQQTGTLNAEADGSIKSVSVLPDITEISKK